MPNTPVRAAAEGMPKITRRKALALTGAFTASAAMVTVSDVAAAAAEPEHPWQRANRLAQELSEVLDECDSGRWHARVFPSSSNEYPVVFGNTKAQESAKTHVSPKLRGLIEAHRAARDALREAMDATDKALIKGKPSKAAWRRQHRADSAEASALMDLCEYRPWNEGERACKGEYLLDYCRVMDGLETRHTLALLRSMTEGGRA
jgi:hypothetical protein